MDTMNDLLICAKAVGYNTWTHRGTGEVFVTYKDTALEEKYGPLSQLYDPHTNDAQAMELLKHLIRTIPDHRTLWLNLINLTRNGELSNEAIIKAVVAMEESK